MRLLLQSCGVKMGHQVDHHNLQSNLQLSIVCLHSWEVIIKKREPKREGPVRCLDSGFRLLLHALRLVRGKGGGGWELTAADLMGHGREQWLPA